MRRAALAFALVLAAAAPLAAQDFDPIVDFQEKSPSCDANPNAAWVGHVSGTSDEDPMDTEQSVSFVGCFETEAECNAWRERGTGVIDGTIREDSCARRSE